MYMFASQPGKREGGKGRDVKWRNEKERDVERGKRDYVPSFFIRP